VSSGAAEQVAAKAKAGMGEGTANRMAGGHFGKLVQTPSPPNHP